MPSDVLRLVQPCTPAVKLADMHHLQLHHGSSPVRNAGAPKHFLHKWVLTGKVAAFSLVKSHVGKETTPRHRLTSQPSGPTSCSSGDCPHRENWGVAISTTSIALSIHTTAGSSVFRNMGCLGSADGPVSGATLTTFQSNLREHDWN